MINFKMKMAIAIFAGLFGTMSLAANGKVSYWGGPVVSHVKVHVIFWGDGIPTEDQNKLLAFYETLVDSTYMDQLAEYATNVKSTDGSHDGTNQTIGRGSLSQHLTITPFNKSHQLTQHDIEVELEKQVEAGVLPKPDADSSYMLHFPNGYDVQISFGGSCTTWLADHEVYRSKKFGNFYYSMFPCLEDSFDALTSAIAHELAETITDPMCPLANEPMVYPAAWIVSDANEIADLCTDYEGTLTSKSGVVYNVQGEWLNSKGGCYAGPYTQN